MNSAFALTIIYGVLVGICAAAPNAEQMKILNDCKTQEKATDDDVQQFINHKQLKGPNSKCFMACAFEKTGVVKDKKIQPDALKAMLVKEVGSNEKTMKQVTDTVNECKAIMHADRCEQAAQLKGCLDKAAVLRGFN